MRLPAYQELSKEQDKIRELPLDESHLVLGPPGTGKSVMALYRAADLMKARKQIRLLVYSRLLSQYTASATGQLDIDATVDTFHSWFTGFHLAHFKRRPPALRPYVYDWPKILTDINENPPPEGVIPYLIIDEGQDLPKEFYLVARHLATNITVFADENQRIAEDNSTIKEIRAYGGFSGEPHVLARNYRNTVEIAKLAATFEQGMTTGVAELPTRSGPMPVMSRFPRLHEEVDFLARFERAYSDLEIGVFTYRKKLQTSIENRLKGKTTNPVQLFVGGQGAGSAVVNFHSPGIKLINFPSTKGLEFDAVFIPSIETIPLGDPTMLMRIYVLLSRAREWLFVSWTGEDRPPILDLFPEHLMEWR